VRKLVLLGAAAAGLVAFSAGQAGAAVLFENTLDPSGPGGGFSAVGSQRFAEDVILAGDATVDQVTWYGASYYGQPYADFDINVFADDGSGLPGALVAHRTGAATTAATSAHDAYGLQTLAFSLNVTPISLTGGAHYHVEIADQGPFNFIWDTSSDATTDAISTNTGYAHFQLAHAFALVGEAGSSTSPTPEPAAWALMIGGFGMAGAMLRRRRPAVA